jgi:hypothetical protein
MSLPRFCKICRLILNYPDLERSDWDEELKAFKGTGFCPDNHYEIELYERDDDVTIHMEKLRYNEYEVQIDYTNDKWIEIYKDHRVALVTTIESWKDVNYRDREAVIYKLDTLINFS